MGKYRTTMANILNDMNQKQQTNLEQQTEQAIGDLMENYNQRSYKDGPGSLDGAFSSQQLQKLKGVWANKSTKDVTPSLMKMIKGWDTPTKHAVAQANINVISKITAKEEVEFAESIDEAAQILAHGGKGQYKVTKNGSNIEIKFKGKVVGTAEFDRGSDSFFVSIKGEKGQKSFDDAQAMADYFAKNKITEDTQLKEDVTMSMGWKSTDNSFNQLMKALKPGSNLTKTINLTVKVDSHMRKIEKLLSKAYSHWEDIEQQVGMNLQDGVVDSSLEDRKERYERVMSHYRLKEEEEPEKPDSAKDVEKGRDDKKKTRIAQLQLQIAKATETINKINAQEK